MVTSSRPRRLILVVTMGSHSKGTTNMTKIAMTTFFAGVLCLAPTAVAQVGAVKTGDSRVEKLLKEANLRYSVNKDGDFQLVNALGDGRDQVVFILSKTVKLATLEIRQIWSIGYRSKTPLPGIVANRLLEKNSEVKLGAWQVLKPDGDSVAIFAAKIAAETDKLSLLSAIQAVTTTADEIEKELTGKDDY